MRRNQITEKSDGFIYGTREQATSSQAFGNEMCREGVEFNIKYLRLDFFFLKKRGVET